MAHPRSIILVSLVLAALSLLSPVWAEDSKITPWFQDTLESNSGLFVVALESDNPTAVLNEFQNWLLTVNHAESGQVVSPARISVGGGMPMHGHGLPTQPKITEYLGEGQYRLEGLKFNMYGQWVLEFEIITAEATDTVVFKVVVDY